MLLLKTPHILIAGHTKKSILKLLGKLPPCQLAFMVSKGDTETTGGIKSLVNLPTVDPLCYHADLPRKIHTMPTDAIVQWLSSG